MRMHSSRGKPSFSYALVSPLCSSDPGVLQETLTAASLSKQGYAMSSMPGQQRRHHNDDISDTLSVQSQDDTRSITSSMVGYT